MQRLVFLGTLIGSAAFAMALITVIIIHGCIFGVVFWYNNDGENDIINFCRFWFICLLTLS